MVGTWQGWSLTESTLDFVDQGNGVYTASIDGISGEWKIVKNGSWDINYGGDGTEMVSGQTYSLVKNSASNAKFASTLKNAKFTLTVTDEDNVTIKIEEITVEHTYSLVGAFNEWRVESTPLTHQEDGSWTADVKEFPGGEQFKISIDNSWTCFVANDTVTALPFGEAYTCARADNYNNFTVGEKGQYYDIHVKLVVADDEQSATLTITGNITGIKQVHADNAKSTIYSITGLKLKEPQKGINIVNGKKVIKK